MSFNASKLKPRIKPRLGARVPLDSVIEKPSLANDPAVETVVLEKRLAEPPTQCVSPQSTPLKSDAAPVEPHCTSNEKQRDLPKIPVPKFTVIQKDDLNLSRATHRSDSNPGPSSKTHSNIVKPPETQDLPTLSHSRSKADNNATAVITRTSCQFSVLVNSVPHSNKQYIMEEIREKNQPVLDEKGKPKRDFEQFATFFAKQLSSSKPTSSKDAIETIHIEDDCTPSQPTKLSQDNIKPNKKCSQGPKLNTPDPNTECVLQLEPQTKKPICAPKKKMRMAKHTGGINKLLSDGQNNENVRRGAAPKPVGTKKDSHNVVVPLNVLNADNKKKTCGDENVPCPLEKPPDDNCKNNSLVEKDEANKPDTETSKIMYAATAFDYLRRHDHAMGNSLLRRVIIGKKYMMFRSLRPTTCSSCNPRTLERCIRTLTSLSKDDFYKALKKSSDRYKTPIQTSSMPGKPLFKPSLGRQRTPTMMASTYGKMCGDVKAGLTKKYGSCPPELSKLRMIDLIFYNPTDKPMNNETDSPSESDPQEGSPTKNDPSGSTSQPRPADTAIEKKKDGADNVTIDGSASDIDHPDEPPEGEIPREETATTSEEAPNLVEESTKPENDVPVPQVKVGDTGQIILAPESLVMQKEGPDVLNKPVVQESGTASKLSKKAINNRSHWNFDETIRFYETLHKLGTDFSTMRDYFPSRSRDNLKSKFKREEKRNPALIYKAMGRENLSLDYIEKELAADKTLRRMCAAPRNRKRPPSCSLNEVWYRAFSEKNLPPKTTLKSPSDPPEDNVAPTGTEADSSKALPDSTEPIAIASEPSNEREIPTKKPISEGKTTGRKKCIKTAPTITKKPGEPANRRKILTKKPISEIKTTARGKCIKTVPTTTKKRKAAEDDDETFKKPTNCAKIKTTKKCTSTNSSKRKVKRPPTLHKLPDDFFASENEDESDVSETSSVRGDDDCYTIEANFDHEEFRCSRSVKFSVANPEWPVEVNETIEHKESLTNNTDNAEPQVESNELVDVIDIGVDDMSDYLLRTGACVIESG